MPKYYVECGNFQIVTHAKNARGAAIWAMHRALGQMLPFLGEPQPVALENQQPIVLGELIKTSERGFGRGDACLHDTFDVVSEWNRLLMALERLQEDASSEATAV
jgi:hypothetical protein